MFKSIEFFTVIFHKQVITFSSPFFRLNYKIPQMLLFGMYLDIFNVIKNFVIFTSIQRD